MTAIQRDVEGSIQKMPERRAALCCAALLIFACATWATEKQPPGGITFRAAATSGNVDWVNTITVATPAGTAAADIMLATIFVRGAVKDDGRKTAAVKPPSGWTLIRRDDYSKENVKGGVSSMLSFYRVATASEPPNHTWTFDAARGAVAGVAAYSGVSTFTPIDAHAGQASAQDAYSTTISAPSLITTVRNTVVVGLFGLHEGAHTITPPAGMTERFQRTSPEAVSGPRPLASVLTLEMADEARAAPAATGKRDATASIKDTWVAQLIALKPASGQR